MIAWMGYLLGRSEKWGGSGRDSLLSSGNRHTRSLIQCQNSEKDFGIGRGLASSEGRESEYTVLLEKDRLEEKNRRMAAIFEGSELGVSLTKLTVLVRYGPDQNSAEGRIVSESLKFIQSDPQQAFLEIHDALVQMPADLTAERQLLIQLVLKLDLEAESKIRFYSEQLIQENKKKDLKSIELNSSPLLLALMQEAVDPSQVEATLRQVLMAQSNYSIRSFLVSVYETKYPDEGKRLRSELGMLDL